MDQENSSSSDPSTIHIQVNTISTNNNEATIDNIHTDCLLYTSPSPRDRTRSRMPSSA